jgi:hypothetical protein
MSNTFVVAIDPSGLTRALCVVGLLVGDSENGLHNVVIASATAKISFEAQAHVLLGWVRNLIKQTDGSHDHSWGAVATLQAMVLTERFLHRVHLITLGQAFDCGDRVTSGLCGKHGAGLHGFTIEVHGAGTTRRGVATNVGSGEISVFSDVVHQEGAILDFVALALTIDGHGYVCHLSPRKGVSFKCCYNKNGDSTKRAVPQTKGPTTGTNALMGSSTKTTYACHSSRILGGYLFPR